MLMYDAILLLEYEFENFCTPSAFEFRSPFLLILVYIPMKFDNLLLKMKRIPIFLVF